MMSAQMGRPKPGRLSIWTGFSKRQVNATAREGRRLRFFNKEGQQARDFARE